MIVCLPAPALSPKPAEARRGSSQPSSALDVIGSVSGSGSMTVHPGCLSVAPDVPGGLLLWGKGPCHVPASTQKLETRNEDVGLRGVGWRRVGGMLQRECNMALPSLQTGASPSTTYENDDCMSPSTDLHIAAAPRPPRSSSAAALAHLTGSSWPSARSGSGKLAAAPSRLGHVFANSLAVARETWGFFGVRESRPAGVTLSLAAVIAGSHVRAWEAGAGMPTSGLELRLETFRIADTLTDTLTGCDGSDRG